MSLCIVNKQMNGYLKVQFRKLRCFVPNFNIDGFTRFCANFLGKKCACAIFYAFSKSDGCYQS